MARTVDMDFHVRDWLIRPELNLCQRGEESIHLTPKAMELLVCLARRRGDVATKDEIFNEVWNVVGRSSPAPR